MKPDALKGPTSDPDFYSRQVRHALAKLPAPIPVAPKQSCGVDMLAGKESGGDSPVRGGHPGSAAGGTTTAGRKPKPAMSKTEQEYERTMLGEHSVQPSSRYSFEGLTIKMKNGHRYCPDFVVVYDDGQVECHEVKGAYKLGSYQRARLAFDQARVEYPGWTWVWAEKGKKGWKVDRWRNGVLVSSSR